MSELNYSKDIFYVSEDGSIFCFGHKISKITIDLYIKASIELKTWQHTQDTQVSSQTSYITKTDILRPYADEYDRNVKENKTRSLTVDTCCLLDEYFFGIKNNTHMWSAYEYPKIGQVINSSEFFYKDERSGYVVKDHGLLTMILCVNK